METSALPTPAAAAGLGFTQTWLLVVLFVGAIAALPWLLRRLQLRQAGGALSSQLGTARVLSAVAVGPQQQRVVTVEVGAADQRAVLVLGVTAQNVQCLHVLPTAAGRGQASEAQGFGAVLQQATVQAGAPSDPASSSGASAAPPIPPSSP